MAVVGSTLALRLRRAREDAGFRTYKAAARACGVSAHTIKAYELDASVPSADTLRRIADVYDASCDWLLGRSHYKDNLPHGCVLVDLEIVQAVRAATSAEAVQSLLPSAPPLLMCFLEVPTRVQVMRPGEALRLSQELVAHVQRVAPDLFDSNQAGS